MNHITIIRRMGRCAFLAAFFVIPSLAHAGPVERFLESADATAALPADAREMMRESWAKCPDCDGGEFLMQALTLLSPPFRSGMEAYDADQFEDAAKHMGELRDDANLFLAINAAAMEIKALVHLERLAEAGERIELLRTARGKTIDEYSFLAAEVEFLHAYCLLADQQFDEAGAALETFLRDRADAPQRLTLAAQQMLAEIEDRLPGRMGEVVDLMQFSTRRLRDGDSGDKLQGRQVRIVELLDKLVEEAEQQEQSCKKSGGSSGEGGQGGQQQGQSPQSPMQQSMLPGGGSAEQMLREGRRANPGDMWGAMPSAERERVLQALRESFPSRYRQLVEQYYEELAKKP